MSSGTATTAGRNERRGTVIGLPEDDGWDQDGWRWALDVGLPPENGGGGGRGGRGGRAANSGDKRDDTGGDDPGRPEDRPWTPIPRQAKAAEPGLIPTQRRLKKTSRSA